MGHTALWLDGEWLEGDAPRGSLLSHSLHYGTGVFEGIRAYATPWGAAVFRLEDHLERLAAGAGLLGLRLDMQEIATAVVESVHRCGHEEAYVRPLAFFGRGLDLDVEGTSSHVVVAAMEWTSHLGAEAKARGVRARLSPMLRNAARAIPPLKLTGAYVNAVLAKREARRHGFEEALFVDDSGRVCEATGENVFLVRRGDVVAAEHPDALPGITRRTILELTGGSTRAVVRDELFEADEVFLTGTSAEVTPVTAVDQRQLPIGPVTRELQDRYARTVRGELPDPEGWLTFVPPSRRRQAS